MKASVGDRLLVHGRIVGKPDRLGEVVEVRGSDGAPPYVVQFEDGRQTLLFPGPDCVKLGPADG